MKSSCRQKMSSIASSPRSRMFSRTRQGSRRVLTTAREQLRAYRRAVLKHAFEGKLTCPLASSDPRSRNGGGALGGVSSTLTVRVGESRIARRKEQRRSSSNDHWKAPVTLPPQGFDGEELPHCLTSGVGLGLTKWSPANLARCRVVHSEVIFCTLNFRRPGS